MTTLPNQHPQLLWKHFTALSAIPRPSTREQAAAAYVVSVAKARGLECKRDEAGNVWVGKPATPGLEGLAPVVLQAHLDMVPQKTKDSTHNFETDPLTLIHEGDWLHAKGTTLGADNGIGASAALAVLESRELRHGPLSALFTVEEEIGLRGAAKVSAEFLPGEFLINMDADSPEELIIGCAGAMDYRLDLPCRRQVVPEGWAGLAVSLGGMSGGHSGADIHRGRANALIALVRVLAGLGLGFEWRLASFSGGDARNAIPREGNALLVTPKASVEQLKAALQAGARMLRNEYQHSDPGMELVLGDAAPCAEALDLESAQRFFDFVRACPNGAFRFSDLQPGMVETSSNIGIIKLGSQGPAGIQIMIRSSVDSAKEEIGAAIAGLVRLAGGTGQVHGNYPGWQPSTQSRLVPLFSAACERVNGKPARIAVVHGGLECGLLKAASPGLDCISCGPLILDMHSPDERVQVSSVAAFWDILVEVLARLPAAKGGA
jgi:dipeptidase D